MEDLIKSINTVLDIEKFNYKTFSYSAMYFIAGLEHLKTKYWDRAVFVRKNIEYDYKTKKLTTGRIPIGLFRKSKKSHMIIGLYLLSETFQHANCLIFSKHKNSIICNRYDPSYSCCLNIDISNEIDYVLRKKFTQLDVKYISQTDMSIVVCPQSYINDYFGYCQTYTLIYIDNFLNNPNKNIITTMSVFPTVIELDNYIKKIVGWIVENFRLSKQDIYILLNYDNVDILYQNYIEGKLKYIL